MLNDELQILVLDSLELGLFGERARHLLDQRQIGRLRKLALLVDQRKHTDWLQQ